MNAVHWMSPHIKWSDMSGNRLLEPRPATGGVRTTVIIFLRYSFGTREEA